MTLLVLSEMGVQDRWHDDDNDDAVRAPPADPSGGMLRAVLDGETYDAVAMRFGITRTGVERRIKALASRAVRLVGIEGVNEDGAAFVRRLRQHREAVLVALDALRDEDSACLMLPRETPVLSEEAVAAGARRVLARSQQPLEDVALYYLLFATGARPLEIARLQVLDYLAADGSVRRKSELRPEIAITGRARPLYFHSARLVEALDGYIAHRLERKLGLGAEMAHRGLDPCSPLFLSAGGLGFQITPYGGHGQRRFRCRAIQEAYRKIWRYAEFKHITALTVRHTVADRLYARGADEMQVGLLLGISERAAVRDVFPRRLPTLDQLTEDLV